jgi:hypothetical protein
VNTANSLAAALNAQINTNHHYFAEKASALSTLMATTNGRDKVCSLIQYNFKLYYQLMSASEIE